MKMREPANPAVEITQIAGLDKFNATPFEELKNLYEIEGLNFKQIAEYFSIWPSNVVRRFQKHDGEYKKRTVVSLNSQAWLEKLKLRQPVAVAKVRGTNGYGRVARGRLDHPAAKLWKVKSPDGQIFKFTNMHNWCRQNEHRFVDSAPSGKSKWGTGPLWNKAARGFKMQVNGRHSHWKGWVVLSVTKDRFNNL